MNEAMKPMGSNDSTATNTPDSSDSLSRRALLTHAAAAGMGVGVLGLVVGAQTGTAQASTTPKQPEAETGHDYPMPTPNPKNEKEYRIGDAFAGHKPDRGGQGNRPRRQRVRKL